jgi:hypothetical protein
VVIFKKNIFFFFTGAIDHALKSFYGHIRTLVRLRPSPDLHCKGAKPWSTFLWRDAHCVLLQACSIDHVWGWHLMGINNDVSGVTWHLKAQLCRVSSVMSHPVDLHPVIMGSLQLHTHPAVCPRPCRIPPVFEVEEVTVCRQIWPIRTNHADVVM